MGCGVPSSDAVLGSGFWGLSLTHSSLSSAGADKKAEAGAGAATEFQFVSVFKLAFCFGGFEWEALDRSDLCARDRGVRYWALILSVHVRVK